MVQRQLKPLELGELLAPVRELRLEPAAPLEPLALPQRPVDVAQRGDFALAAARARALDQREPAAAALRRVARRRRVRVAVRAEDLPAQLGARPAVRGDVVEVEQ